MRERIESLFHASAAGDLETVERILGEGDHDVDGDNRWASDIDPRGWQRSPLHAAVDGGHLDLARWLLEKGADVNRQDRFGNTPLTRITTPPLQAHWLEAVELLMSHGADPTIRNADDESAIDYAAKIPVNWKKVEHLFGKYIEE